ncbi:E3 ubiquitin/ISG15 ligase TRIM25-like [Hyperolius riggenbachi]|uniref:E3 ubiquitin/ISG15 ligase TRIM25-like n=1 Tax=Hyperolius riggenbachi TaxID=752182 RepID=UPI0035A3C060
MACAVLLEELSCSICLNIFTEPVALRCGHTFCQACIGMVLDSQSNSSQAYSCPECGEEYVDRPLLEKSRKLCNIAKQFEATLSQLEESGVSCTYCTHPPIRATKTCLQCEISLCNHHLNLHNRAVDHVLVEPTESLEDRRWPTHKKLLEYHCCEDSTCVCVSCFAIGSHRAHQVESLDEAMAKKKENLKKVLETLASESGKVDDKVQHLLNLRLTEKTKASDLRQRYSQLFNDARRQLDEMETKVFSSISKQEDLITAYISILIQELESQKELLSKKVCHIEELCKITDPLVILQDKKSDSRNLSDLKSLKITAKMVDQKDNPKLKFDEGLIMASMHVEIYQFVTSLKKGFCIPENTNICLDSDTAASNVLVSGDLKSASWTAVPVSRPANSRRCVSFCQVLTKNTFSTGQHYWEVDTSNCPYWMVGLTYDSIARDGTKSKIGNNKKSWCLNRAEVGYLAYHNSQATKILPSSPVQRIGVYLNYERGCLSFYQLGNPIGLLYTFTANFTEPLHAAFVVWKDGWIRLKT